MSDADRATLSEKAKEVLSWVDGNPSAEREEYLAKKKELEDVAGPILAATSQAAGGSAAGGASPMDTNNPPAHDGPSIEELD